MREYVQRLYEALQRGHKFVTHDIWSIGRPGEEVPKGLIIKQIRVVILLVQNLLQGTMMLRASALTFATILSIVPFFAIMFYFVQTFEIDEAIFAVVRERVDKTLYEATELLPGREREGTAPAATEPTAEVVPVAPPADATPVAGHDPYEELQDQIRHVFFGDVAQDVEGYADPVDFVFRLANNLAEEAARDPSALLVFGIVLFFTTILGLLRNIEGSFNHIWGVSRTRPWYRMVSDYMMIIILLPFVAAALLGVTAALSSGTLDSQLGRLSFAVRGVQYAIVWFIFSALYYVVPNTRVKVRYAILGGVVAGTLWMLLSVAYVKFQIGITNYSPTFSTFALFPVLLMWIYLSWVILLFGTELAFAYQNEETFAMERHAAGASYAYREALGLRVVAEVARRFEAGLPGLAPETAVRELNVPTRLVNDTLDTLEKAGLVTACATQPVTYQPARSLEKMTIGDVISALREAGRNPSALRDDELFEPWFRELDHPGGTLGRTTVAELVKRIQAAEQGPKTVPFKNSEARADSN